MNQYSDGRKYDSEETRARKAESARRRTGAKRQEWARIEENIERIGQANDGAACGIRRNDVMFYIRKITNGGFLKCRMVG